MLFLMCQDEKSSGIGRDLMRSEEICARLQSRRPSSRKSRFQPSAQPSAMQHALRNPEEIGA